MSGDEAVVLIISCLIATVRWVSWYRGALAPPRMMLPHSARWPLVFGPLICAVLLLVVLQRFASHDVRDSVLYTFFYMAMGLGWIGLGTLVFPAMGLFAAQDVIGRRNYAANWAVTGALLGLTLAFAGGNIGDGPGWWVVIFSALLSTGTWYLVWSLSDLLAGTTRSTTVERDVASGVRLGALLAGAGLIVGRAVAGDWHSVEHTLVDFGSAAWPVAGFVIFEAIVAFAAHPRADNPSPPSIPFGYFPALIYLGAAIAWVVSLGWWT